MARKRTSEDEVLALLARLARPLEREEVAEQLGWTKQRAATVLRGMAQAAGSRIVVTQGGARETRGPRPDLFSLIGAEPAKAEPRLPYFEPNTVVVTPSGREARVIAMRSGGFVEIEYLQVRIGHEPRATVHAKLLRAFQAGRERPDPVRIGLTPDPSAA